MRWSEIGRNSLNLPVTIRSSPAEVWVIRKRQEKGLNLDEKAPGTTMIQGVILPRFNGSSALSVDQGGQSTRRQSKSK